MEYLSAMSQLIFTVQEGLFLHSHHVSPYDGGVFHQVGLHLLPLKRVLY